MRSIVWMLVLHLKLVTREGSAVDIVERFLWWHRGRLKRECVAEKRCTFDPASNKLCLLYCNCKVSKAWVRLEVGIRKCWIKVSACNASDEKKWAHSSPTSDAYILTSEPIEPTPSTLKADLAVFINPNMLITNIIGKNAQWLCVSSTSASKFEFFELPIGSGSTQFEFIFAHDTNLQIYISHHAPTFIMIAHSNLYPRNISTCTFF